MTKEEFDKLPEEEQAMMQIGARLLTRIMNEMEKVESGDDPSVLVFTTRDVEGNTAYFNVSGYVKAEDDNVDATLEDISPQNRDV